MTRTIDRLVRIWCSLAVTLVLGLVAAAPVRAGCVSDGQGPDDVPGQKDLSKWCEPGPTCSSSSTTLSLLWQFDDTSWSGSNTGDACALIDINRDGMADRAVCVTVFGNAQMAGKCSNDQTLGCTKDQNCPSGGRCVLPTNNTGAARCYTCANTSSTNCTNAMPVACTSICSVGIAVGADPFYGYPSHMATNKCNGSNCLANDAMVSCCLTSSDIGAGGELIDVCSYPSQSPNSNPSDCVITPPNCSTDADCDDHNPCTVDMCATGTGGAKFCDNIPGNAGTVCRASVAACDAAEMCTGTSRDCPADQLAPAGTVCRASAGPCDAIESCTGTSASCPADSFQSTATVCRPSTGPCDMAENCTGTSAGCPADGFKSAGTLCRASVGPCDVAETCTGSSATCPADGFQSVGTVCRASAGPCDVAESCTGSSAACPTDGFQSAGTVCRASAGPCDVAESCTGSSAACPTDGFQSAGAICRASAGYCDVAETCTGASADCPADQFKSGDTVCRPSAGVCDAAENCTGTSANCPADQFKSTDVVCRPSAGDCDVAENCTGTSANCPPDGYQPPSLVCRQVYCSGTGSTCP